MAHVLPKLGVRLVRCDTTEVKKQPSPWHLLGPKIWHSPEHRTQKSVLQKKNMLFNPLHAKVTGRHSSGVDCKCEETSSPSLQHPHLIERFHNAAPHLSVSHLGWVVFDFGYFGYFSDGLGSLGSRTMRQETPKTPCIASPSLILSSVE